VITTIPRFHRLMTTLASQGFVERFCKRSSEEFWKEFMDADGKHMLYTGIMDALCQECKEEYASTVKLAHATYKEDFGKYFSYSKHGQKVVMSLPHKIHEQYYKLNPRPSLD
jgi:hypothetical protein